MQSIRQIAYVIHETAGVRLPLGKTILEACASLFRTFDLYVAVKGKVVDAVFATLPHRVIHWYSVDAVDVMVTPCCT